MTANNQTSEYDGIPRDSDARTSDRVATDGPFRQSGGLSVEGERSENEDRDLDFPGLPNDLVNVGKFVQEVAPLSNPISAKSVSETFGIDESELYKSDNDEELTRAVADLD